VQLGKVLSGTNDKNLGGEASHDLSVALAVPTSTIVLKIDIAAINPKTKHTFPNLVMDGPYLIVVFSLSFI
jgi:hypothetical protein